MSTVLDILGSLVIGGCVILAGLTLNSRMVSHMDASTASLNAQESLVDVVHTLEVDFRKMGYRTSDPRTAIAVSRPDAILFRADLDRDGVVDEILWARTDIASASGDSLSVLVRQVNNESPLVVARNVMNFHLSYLRQDGTPADTVQKGEIWIVEATLRLRGDYRVADAVRGEEQMGEVESFWRQTRLSSRNLKRHG